ncbi:MAG: DUF4197 domain-containing protein [Rhodoferax sp.]|jgi:hypothetical protein|uniref:DUF4197 domain-containing protein n=1 Tax=Rhodoferax sp. TaxID=50421 RepID=UPI001B6A3505|nr:DUF4197 domain-containing protein [Rhodoferax sp.]MBP9149303.1 DUF4197 domain-containing protein [Rhodoferax sp.]MBP9735416.1 DUF4197 domain-containing protein [Rhodoferax sp.]
MQRRTISSFLLSSAASSLAVFHLGAVAQTQGLSNQQVSNGLKTALEQGARAAVAQLGRQDGFWSNDKVRIPLPGFLQDTAKLLRRIGQGDRLDELLKAMNQAAEAAVPLAKDSLVAAVKSMSFQDAATVLRGGDTSVTEFFASKTRLNLTEKFLPVVTKTTSRVDLATKYNRIISKAAGMGMLRAEQQSLEHYVTDKTLDGLYFMIGQEEKKIRRDPIGTGSALLGKVFGTLR